MAISPQLLSDLRLPELTANCCPTNSWNWPTVLDEQLFVAQQFTDKCVRKLIFTFSWHECCKLSNTYLYHNTLMSYQQGPLVLHFFSGDKRKWQYMVFLFCESMKIWRRKVNKVSLFSVQIWFIPVVQFFNKTAKPVLTLEVPRVTNIDFLLTISLEYTIKRKGYEN